MDKIGKLSLWIAGLAVFVLLALAVCSALGETVYTTDAGMTAVRQGQSLTLSWPFDEEGYEYSLKITELNTRRIVEDLGNRTIYYQSPSANLALEASKHPLDVALYGRWCRSCAWAQLDELFVVIPEPASEDLGWRCEGRAFENEAYFLGLAMSNAQDEEAEGVLRAIGPGVERSATVRVPAGSTVQGAAWEFLDLDGVELLTWTSPSMRLDATLWLVRDGTVADPLPFASCERVDMEAE